MSADQSLSHFRVRSHRPGDMGLITYHHGITYSAEPYNWGPRCESVAARITAEFIDNFNPEKERCWIAEKNGEFLGCVMVIRDPDANQVARLRLLLVTESSRGMGVGTRLIQECINFTREAGYTTLTLWTQSILEGARRLYKRAGFALVESEEHDSFGQRLIGEKWRLEL